MFHVRNPRSRETERFLCKYADNQNMFEHTHALLFMHIHLGGTYTWPSICIAYICGFAYTRVCTILHI